MPDESLRIRIAEDGPYEVSGSPPLVRTAQIETEFGVPTGWEDPTPIDAPEFEPSIAVIRDGPLWVRGGFPVESADGTTYEVRNRVTLCRCGRSSNEPFCDGTHEVVGFRHG